MFTRLEVFKASVIVYSLVLFGIDFEISDIIHYATFTSTTNFVEFIFHYTSGVSVSLYFRQKLKF